MKEKIISLIVEKLENQVEHLRASFLKSSDELGVKFCFLDNLLPDNIAYRIHKVFPDASSMRLMDSFREKKYTTKSFDRFDPLLAEITFAIQDHRVIRAVERITGIQEQIPDSSLYAGGLSAMGKGHFLNPHIDNSHEDTRRYYRTLNLLYYVTPDWSHESGGNLELWDRSVQRNATIVSKFNRLVIMETNPWSWHSVSKVNVDQLRHCVSNYYFSPRSPIGKDYFNVTSFSARPEQKVRRALSWADNKVRQAVRLVKPSGLGKRDLYQGPNK